jgi:hypothetical protein
MQTEDMRLDGNSAGGALRELFARDVTAARVTCIGCHATRPMANTLLYGGTMGVVLRCPQCDSVVLRLVRTPAGLHLDVSGLSFMTIGD